jgi:hypothetical protein
MSTSRGLHRRIDVELVERIQASGLPKKVEVAKKKVRLDPRNRESYRAARRNAARKAKTKMIRLGPEVEEGWTPAPELNRSQKWSRAISYSYAREISPYPERPVR